MKREKTDLEIAIDAGIPHWLNEPDRIAAIAQIKRIRGHIKQESDGRLTNATPADTILLGDGLCRSLPHED
jgi:hypothetical protein